MLRARPGFTLVALLTLALGIGANTAIFSVVDAVVLRPPPYQDPGRLFFVWATNPGDGNRRRGVTLAELEAWRGTLQSWSTLAAASSMWNEVLGDGDSQAEVVPALYVSANLLPTLGVAPALGRAFLPEEDVVGGPRAAILSHAAWQRRFGGDPGVVGRRVSIEGASTTIIGVMPVGVEFLDPSAELWLPLALNSGARKLPLLSVVGRLRPGAGVK